MATAQAQSAANADAVRESAKVNAIDQITPYGNVTFQRNAQGIPTAQVTTLNPQQQQLLDKQGQIGNILAGQALNQAQYLPTTRFTLDGIPPSPSSTDFGQQASEVRDAVFNQARGLLDPVFEQRQRQLDQTIANRGLPIAGEAATTLQGNFNRDMDNALQQAAYQAVQAGGAEQNRLFNLADTSRQRGINELLLERQQPFNELSAFLQGAPVFQSPQANPLPFQQIAAPDVQGLISNQYAQQNQARSSGLGALAGLGGSFLGGSAFGKLF